MTGSHQQVMERAPFACRYSSYRDFIQQPAGLRPPILATIVHGDQALPDAAWPRLSSGMRPCDGSGTTVETWHVPESPRYDRHEGFQVAATDQLIFVGVQVPIETGGGITLQVQDLYLRMLRLIEQFGYRHLLRVWNIVPGINDDADGMERYKRFCIGRHDAFMMERPELAERYPSASAIGPRVGDLCLYCLAAREPGLPVENPNQVSAYHYPPQYGPRSPSFSRALVKRWPGSAVLFLSGTASVAGHRTKHLELPVAQTEETVFNLRALIANGEKLSGARFPLVPERSFFKAFIRNTDDYGAVRRHLEDVLGPDTPMLYVEADICRANLLFEIEGFVWSS